MNIENLGDLLAKTEEELDVLKLKYCLLTEILKHNYNKTIEFFGKDNGFIAIPIEEVEMYLKD